MPARRAQHNRVLREVFVRLGKALVCREQVHLRFGTKQSAHLNPLQRHTGKDTTDLMSRSRCVCFRSSKL